MIFFLPKNGRPGHRNRFLRTLAIACSLFGPVGAGLINGPVLAESKAAVVSGVSTGLSHPLDPLSAAEIQTAFETVLTAFKTSQDLPKESLRFPLMALGEPAKDFVLAWKPGQPMPRMAEVQILHNPSNRFWLADVDLVTKRLVKISLQPAGTQPGLATSEFTEADAIVHADPGFRNAIRSRGLNPDLVYVDVWAPGDAPLAPDISAALPFGKNTRMVRCLAFYRGAPIEAMKSHLPQNPYVRPIEGLVITVDMNARKVINISDRFVGPVIAITGNSPVDIRLSPNPAKANPPADLKLNGHLVNWHQWQFYLSLHPREGLVISDVRYNDKGRLRPLAYRMSLSEVYVPYGIADPSWSWRNAFDVGEYNAGMLAQTLIANRDLPSSAVLLNAVFPTDQGPTKDNPAGTVTIPAAIGLYERDSGILWSRTDPTNYERDTRYGRELVATWNTWVGNYIYSFDWVFQLDGTIAVRTKLTGTTLNRGSLQQNEASSPKVGQDQRGVVVEAPYHQHFLNFRLDLDVDGPANQAMEMEVVPITKPGFSHAFGTTSSHLASEGFRDVDPFKARHWHVESATNLNPFGKPTGYAIEPDELAFPYGAPNDPGLQKGLFAKHQIWFTRYHPKELYASGNFPNQARKPDGLPEYIKDQESLHGQDLVTWYTVGLTHLSRPEDYPVMPSDSIGFRIMPRGFFASNPALGVSDSAVKGQEHSH
jgi:primary-amine oxidase